MNKEAINQRIQALKSELAALKAELAKPEKFKFRYTDTKTSFIGSYCVSHNTSGLDPYNSEHFRYRQTKENAQADFQLQKELMCIGALAEQIDPNYKNKKLRQVVNVEIPLLGISNRIRVDRNEFTLDLTSLTGKLELGAKMEKLTTLLQRQ